MATGLTTPEIDPVTISTEVLVNGPDGTGRQAILDLALQLAAAGALAEALASAVSTAAGLNGRLTTAEAALLTKASASALATVSASLVTAIGRLDTIEGAAFDAADIYETTAAGLAATTVGQQFKVVSSDDDVAYLIYRHDAGSTPTLLSMVPAPAALAEKVSKSDGFGARAATGHPQLLDANGIELLGFDDDGKAMFRASAQVLSQIVSAVSSALAASLLTTDLSPFPSLRDGNGVELLGFDKEGKARFAISVDVLSQISAQLDISSTYDPVGAGLIASSDILLLGDSMSTLVLANAISAALGGRPVALLQKGGQDAYALAVIMGVIPLTVTLDGNTIPASGGVAVTVKSTNILFSGGTYTGTANVTIAGVAGVLSTDSTGNWTFTRSAAGEAVAVAAGVAAVLSPTTGTSFIPATNAYLGRTLIIWAFRNGSKATRAARTARTLEPLRKIAAALTPRCKRIIWITAYNQNSANEPSGSTGYKNLMALNEEGTRELGPYVLDMRSAAVKNAIYDIGDTPDATDLADMAADCIPTRYFVDSTHVNDTLKAWQGTFIGNYCRANGI